MSIVNEFNEEKELSKLESIIYAQGINLDSLDIINNRLDKLLSRLQFTNAISDDGECDKATPAGLLTELEMSLNDEKLVICSINIKLDKLIDLL